MVKLVGLLLKPETMSQERFRAHWLGTHAGLASKLPGLRRYTINVIDRREHPDAVYDGFSELWFDSGEALDAAFAGPAGKAIAQDIPTFMSSLTRVVVEEYVIIP